MESSGTFEYTILPLPTGRWWYRISKKRKIIAEGQASSYHSFVKLYVFLGGEVA